MSRKSDGEPSEDGKGDKGYDRGTARALALATQLGLSIALPMVVFIAAGVWADNQFGTKPWCFFFVGLTLGIGSAGAAFYQIATALPTKPYKPPAKPASGAADKAPPKDDPLWGEYDPDDDGR